MWNHTLPEIRQKSMKNCMDIESLIPGWIIHSYHCWDLKLWCFYDVTSSVLALHCTATMGLYDGPQIKHHNSHYMQWIQRSQVKRYVGVFPKGIRNFFGFREFRESDTSLFRELRSIKRSCLLFVSCWFSDKSLVSYTGGSGFE